MRRMFLTVVLIVAGAASPRMQTPNRIERTSTGWNLPFSAAVRAGGLIHVSGTMATDASAHIVASDIKAQTRKTLENITDGKVYHGLALPVPLWSRSWYGTGEGVARRGGPPAGGPKGARRGSAATGP